MDRFDVSVIGQGYAGLTLAHLARERGLHTVNVEAQMMGGLIINVNELEPRPAEAEHSGADLASGVAMKNLDDGVVNVSEAVTGLERGTDGAWIVHCGARSHAARHVVIASGARLKKLRVPGEAAFFGQGVSECADCDGPLFAGLETVVIGGGDSAFQEALALSQFAQKVTILIRGEKPRARVELCQRVAANSKIAIVCNTRVLAIDGRPGKGVTAVRVASTPDGERTLATAGVFVFIGLEPCTDFLPPQLKRDADGAVITSEQCATTLLNLWAIGAVRSGFGGLLSDAAADAHRVVGQLSPGRPE